MTELPHGMLRNRGARRDIGEPTDSVVLPAFPAVPSTPVAAAAGEHGGTSALAIGELCIDHNEADGRLLPPSWGSPALFVTWWLKENLGLDVKVSGSHGSDVLPLIRGFSRDRDAQGQRTLSYKNVIKTTDPTATGTTQSRTQYWRPADRPTQPLRPRDSWQDLDLLYFCPLEPDADRAEDIQTLAGMRQSSEGTLVLLAQGLMRRSGAGIGGDYREVLVRGIEDEEAARWACFDIVVFSSDDQPDAVARATRWSADPAASNSGFVVTQGERGATLCFRGNSTHFPPERVVTDQNPVGAGDAFSAAMGVEFHAALRVDRIARPLALERAVREANRAAAEFVERASQTQPSDLTG